MQKLYKQFAAWATKWKTSNKVDEFFVARLRLTFYYFITATVILAGSSIILYNTILSNLSKSILESTLNPFISEAIIAQARDILLSRFLTINAVIIFFIIILGFLLTYKTLQPIKTNMQKQKRFIADASHELRTPVAVVISGLEVNLNNKKLDLPGAKKVLEDTLEEMREFSKLSNNLLDLSKHDKRAEYEPVPIGELIKSIVSKNENLAQAKEISIETSVESGGMVRGNKIELGRVFYNILDNAIKYTPPGGKISISDKIILNNFILTVTNSGQGIPRAILDKMFDPFFRGDTARSEGGAGLGLTLSKKIVENHGGNISIKSEEGRGTSVIISLPLSS